MSALPPGQDPSQSKKHRLLQRHRLWRRGGVELCLEDVPERHPGLRGLPAESSHGVHPATLAAQQVRVIPAHPPVSPQEDDGCVLAASQPRPANPDQLARVFRLDQVPGVHAGPQ